VLPARTSQYHKAAKPVLVEAWRVGDDALTMKFDAALEEAFKASPRFSTSRGRLPGTLIVQIADHVMWKQADDRVRISYKIEFSDVADRSLGHAFGKCWMDELPKCTADIVKRATAAAHELKRDQPQP
jgi:hypothetical protein